MSGHGLDRHSGTLEFIRVIDAQVLEMELMKNRIGELEGMVKKDGGGKINHFTK